MLGNGLLLTLKGHFWSNWHQWRDSRMSGGSDSLNPRVAWMIWKSHLARLIWKSRLETILKIFMKKFQCVQSLHRSFLVFIPFKQSCSQRLICKSSKQNIKNFLKLSQSRVFILTRISVVYKSLLGQESWLIEPRPTAYQINGKLSFSEICV